MSEYDDYVPVSFTNVKVQWAKVHDPDEYKGSKKFKLEMYFESKEDLDQSELFKKEGFNVRKKGDKIILGLSKAYDKAKHMNADGKKCIKVVGPDGITPFLEDLGNGTVCNIKATAKKWDVSSTVTLYLEAVQVVNHVAYAGSDSFGDVSSDSPF